MSSLKITIAGEGMRSIVSVPSANSKIYDLLVDFCKKNKRDPDGFALKYKNQAVDLGLPFRLAGIPNNATVDVERIAKKKSGTVSIAVQFPDGQRLVGAFGTKVTLWDVLLASELANTKNILKMTQKDKKLKKDVYMQPVLTCMNTMIKTIDELQTRTLASLGLRHGDNALVRLAYEPTQQTLEEVLDKINNYKPDAETPKKTSTTSQLVSSTIPKEPEKAPEQESLIPSTPSTQEVSSTTVSDVPSTTTSDTATPAPSTSNDVMDVDETTSAQQDTTNLLPIEDPCAKFIKLYKMLDIQFNLQDVKVADKEFELSAQELKSLVTDIEKKREANDLLKTQKMRDLEKKKVEKKYLRTLIRFRYPSGLIIQATFKPGHTIQQVYNFVAKTIANPETPYYMYVSPPIKRLDQDMASTLQELGFVPAVIVNVALDKKRAKDTDQEPTIKQEFMPLLQDVQDVPIPAAVGQEEKPKQQEKNDTKKQSQGRTLGSASSTKQPTKTSALPKWFKK